MVGTIQLAKGQNRTKRQRSECDLSLLEVRHPSSLSLDIRNPGSIACSFQDLKFSSLWPPEKPGGLSLPSNFLVSSRESWRSSVSHFLINFLFWYSCIHLLIHLFYWFYVSAASSGLFLPLQSRGHHMLSLPQTSS